MERQRKDSKYRARAPSWDSEKEQRETEHRSIQGKHAFARRLPGASVK